MLENDLTILYSLQHGMPINSTQQPVFKNERNQLSHGK